MAGHFTRSCCLQKETQVGLVQMVNKAIFILHKYVHGMSTFIYTDVCVHSAIQKRRKKVLSAKPGLRP